MAKRIFIATSGTRGDVEPFIALAKALKLAGYDVVLAAESAFGDWIASHGVTHHAAGIQFAEKTHEFVDVFEANRFRGAALENYKLQLREAFACMAEAGANADILIYSTLLASLSFLCEAHGKPGILANLAPAFPTGDFAVPVLPNYSYGRVLNRLSHRASDFLGWIMFRSLYNDARREILGLRPLGRLHDMRKVNGAPLPVLNAVSEAMVPRPHDWPDYVHMTGNWFLDAGEWTPPPELTAFLADGPPPIYIGFGSMPIGLMKKRAPVLIEALRRSSQRAIFARGWGGWIDELLASLGSQVHLIDGAPHQHLLPLMAGVAHHGGAGTTAAGLRAGRPTLVTPLIVDQFFHGALVARHGAGPKPLPVKQWRVDILAERLRELTATVSYRERAQEIAARMATEDGVTGRREVRASR